ncbi:MAG: hypothetical protein EHM14_02890 [Methanothrix sp.]|nr:MAG: hypothetical protein EHM14_02890 [Methanothrix sp.]
MIEMQTRKNERRIAVARLIALFMLSITMIAIVEAEFTSSEKQEILAAQNKYRSEVNVTPLAWSENLSLQAQNCADINAVEYLPKNQQKHCPMPGCGQNIARASSNLHFTLTKLVDLWGDEKQYFINGRYPSVSSIGSPGAVSHYTQMIWQDTNEVGCGKANSSGYDILVCDYSPKGNIDGTAVYSSVRPKTFAVGSAGSGNETVAQPNSTGKESLAMAKRNVLIGSVFNRPVSCYGPARV